jgi:hypothetical protein
LRRAWPLYPGKRTPVGAMAKSAKGHKQTSRPNK